MLLVLVLSALALGAWAVQPPSGSAPSLLQRRVLASMAENQPTVSAMLVTWPAGARR